ncbi:hypothetical protein ACFPRL_30570 [Pseudoclavibacter helvolus]
MATSSSCVTTTRARSSRVVASSSAAQTGSCARRTRLRAPRVRRLAAPPRRASRRARSCSTRTSTGRSGRTARGGSTPWATSSAKEDEEHAGIPVRLRQLLHGVRLGCVVASVPDQVERTAVRLYGLVELPRNREARRSSRRARGGRLREGAGHLPHLGAVR